MLGTRQRRRIGRMVLAAIFGLSASAAATASPIPVNETFRTTGSIGSTGVSGTPVLSFQGVDRGAMTTGTPFDLGRLHIATPPEGTTTTYSSTPMDILFTPKTVNGDALGSDGVPTGLRAFITGTVNGLGQADLHIFLNHQVFLDDPPDATFQTGPWSNSLNITNLASLNTLTTSAGATSIQAQVEVVPVPEPVSWASFLVLAGTALFIPHRRIRSITVDDR